MPSSGFVAKGSGRCCYNTGLGTTLTIPFLLISLKLVLPGACIAPESLSTPINRGSFALMDIQAILHDSAWAKIRTHHFPGQA